MYLNNDEIEWAFFIVFCLSLITGIWFVSFAILVLMVRWKVKVQIEEELDQRDIFLP